MKTSLRLLPPTAILAALCLTMNTAMAAGKTGTSRTPRVSTLVVSNGDVKAAFGSGFKVGFHEVLPNTMANTSASNVAPGLATVLAGRVTGYVNEYSRVLTSYICPPVLKVW